MKITLRRLLPAALAGSNLFWLPCRTLGQNGNPALSASVRIAKAESQSSAGSDPAASVEEGLRLSYYQYDKTLPLNATTKLTDKNDLRTRYDLTYDSAHDQRVTVTLALPHRASAPYPAVLLMHGSGGDRNSDYIRAASDILNSRGFATVSLDAQYRGDRKRPGKTGELQPDSYTIRDAWVQTVIDQRRAIDCLGSRADIDSNRIGYLGFSMGGMLGAVLGGVEPRVKCFFLAVPGGGIVNAVKHIDNYPMLKEKFAVRITPEVMRRIEDIAEVIDPIYFVGKILPRPLMITVGMHDEIIPAEMSSALIAAAHAQEPENVLRMNSGHIPPLTIAIDIRNFFDAHLSRQNHSGN